MARPVTLKHLILFTLHSMRESRSASAGAPWEKNREVLRNCACLRVAFASGKCWRRFETIIGHTGAKSDKDTLVWDSLVPVRQISTFTHSAVVSKGTCVEGQLDAQLGNWFFSVRPTSSAPLTALSTPPLRPPPTPITSSSTTTHASSPQIRHVQNRVFPIYFCIKRYNLHYFYKKFQHN